MLVSGIVGSFKVCSAAQCTDDVLWIGARMQRNIVILRYDNTI